MIPKETVDLILDTARIDEVVGEFVTLRKKSGAYLTGLCPFHNEKTPSFTVTPSRGIYKCFGCGKAGNSVNFVMDHEHLSYPEALRWLARRYNIEIKEEEQSAEQVAKDNERESLFIVSSFAQKHFTHNLLETEEGKAIGLSYFRERGFRNDIIEKFQLGYGIDKWRDFTDAAIAQGYKLEYLVKAGLTIQKEDDKDKYFDRFSARVMFPIHNVSGRVIAFGGRTLRSDKKVAKYINSPETDIYHKSNVLYGIYFAKKMMVQEDNCYLVEGYTDVISMHQSGIENVVASSGTSLTIEQIRLIRRYTNNITILYDGDPAGIKASFRGIDLVLEEGMNVRVLLFPDNDDPDSYSKKVSSDELRDFIKNNTKDFIAFKTQLLIADVQNDPIKKAGLIRDIVESIALIPDAITRSVYVKECARIMDIDEQALLNELNKIRRKNFDDRKKTATAPQTPVDDPLQGVPPEDFIPDEYKDGLPDQKSSGKDSLFQEQEIIRLLLSYGTQTVTAPGEDDEGRPIEITVSLADLLVHELQQDSIALAKNDLQKIFDEFVAHLDKHAVPDLNYFTNHTDTEISKAAIDLVTYPYALSDWEKHHIYVQTESMMLKRAALDSVYALKLRRIEMMLTEQHKLLKQAEEEKKDDDIIRAVEALRNLEEAKRHFSKLLGRVIIH